jgi:DNA-binding FadR family transcriptional regulator
VSRATIRQALAILESAGTITRTVGRGTFLTENPVPQPIGVTTSMSDVSPSDVMEARSLIEAHSMPLTVANATPAEIAEMDRCLLGGDSATTYAEFEEWDLALHRALIAATHNTLLVRLYASIDEARRGELWGRLKLRSDSTDRRVRYRAEHHSVVDAVKARDSTLATNCMARHLASVSANLLGWGNLIPTTDLPSGPAPK